MAKLSMKRMGKEVGPASVYAQPHDMSGNKVDITDGDNGHNMGDSCAKTVNMSVGNINRSGYDPTPKNDGIKIRGTGAATKGTKARGPMA